MFWRTLILSEASDNTANTSSNTCLNSLADKCRGIEARAYHIIDASEVELKPCEIVRITSSGQGQGHNAWAIYHCPCSLRKVASKRSSRLTIQGAYCNKITYGVRFAPLCVHNISLRSFVCQDVKKRGAKRWSLWEASRFMFVLVLRGARLAVISLVM